MNNDLISREWFEDAFNNLCFHNCNICEYFRYPKDGIEDSFYKCALIDNAPTVEITEEQAIDKLHETGWLPRHDKEMTERPKGEYVDISKLRLMKVEECAGHTIEYAMGWKACVEWIKKGGEE